jgi:XTP/dITP diphosphohydrolase
MSTLQQQLEAFNRLLDIMDDLREKCPWDKKQTLESLRHLTIEETYELGDAILDNDLQEIKKELGDLLLHIVFYAKIGSETNEFDIADVANSICDKLIDRHPHIYGDVVVADEEEVKQNWEKLKLKEGKKSVLGGVPASLPAITKAVRLQEKAAQVGFEWSVTDEVKAKLQEELEELDEAVQIGKQEDIESEFGDVLFSMINLARFLRIDPDNAQERTNKKFKKRFELMESKLIASGKDLMSSSLAEMDEVWNEIKKDEP